MNFKYDCTDALSFCRTLDDDSIKLLITSPPYNIGKEYEIKLDIEQYLDAMKPYLKEFVRVIAEDGSICWQVGNYVDKGEVYPPDIFSIISCSNHWA